MTRWFLCLPLLLAALACQRSPTPDPPVALTPAMKSKLKSDFAKVRATRVLFLHHSVGHNILDGVANLAAELGEQGFVDAKEEAAFSTGGPQFAHGSRGENGKPDTKIQAFVDLFRKQAKHHPDIAFMKFCFVDFNPNSDVDKLFAEYTTAMGNLAKKHPEVKFVHTTVPLTRRQEGLKWTAFRLVGKSVWGDDSNVKRYQFNQRLLETYGPDQVFDLAGVESTGPDGAPTTFTHQGKSYPSLDPRYTDDGGHLNQTGQRVAAIALLEFLAKVASSGT